MVDTVQNASEVLFALRDAMRADTRLGQCLFKVMSPANTEPSKAVNGWIGLYIEDVDYSPRTAGAGSRNWAFRPRFKFLVQASNMNSSEDAFERLEGYVKTVIDVALANYSLASKVEALTDITVQYAFRSDDASSMHFVGALVTMVFEGRSN